MKLLRKFYINKKSNILITVFFMSMIIMNIIAIVYDHKVMSIVSGCLELLGISIISIFLFIFNKDEEIYTDDDEDNSIKGNVFAGLVSYKDIDEGSINVSDKIFIERETHRNNIKEIIEKIFYENQKGLKGMIITGDSGSGKSILINMLKDDLQKAGYDVQIKRDDYSYLKIDLKDLSKHIIFLDHFEKAIGFDGYISAMKEYANENNIIFVFSFPQNSLANIHTILNKNFGNIIRYTYVLYINEDDKKACIEKIERFIKCKQAMEVENCIKKIEEGTHTNRSSYMEILCEELVDISEGLSPLIEFELLGYILNYDYRNNKKINNKLSFIDLYLDNWVENFEHRETAYAILYLLSDSGSYSIDDIKLATFENEKYFSKKYNSNKIGKTLALLLSNPFIYSYSFNTLDYFEPMHNYIAKQLWRYCSSKDISEGTRYYIDYLKKCIEGKEQNLTEYKKAYEEIKKNYESFYKKTTANLLNLYIF